MGGFPSRAGVLLQLGDDVGELVYRFSFRARQCRADGRQQRAVFGEHHVGVFPVHVVGKRLAQRGDESERAAAEEHGRLDVASVGKRDYRLHGHGVEDGSGDVLLADVLRQQVLDVGLAEHAAPRCDGVYLPGVLRQPVHLLHVGAEDDGHLVDERARSASTVPVHAQVLGFRVLEEHDLGILSADVYHGAHLRVVLLYRLRGGHHLLHKRHACLLGDAHAHGAGDSHLHVGVAKRGGHFLQHAAQRFLGLCVVPQVFGIYYSAVCSHGSHFGCCGAYVYAYPCHNLLFKAGMYFACVPSMCRLSSLTQVSNTVQSCTIACNLPNEAGEELR